MTLAANRMAAALGTLGAVAAVTAGSAAPLGAGEENSVLLVIERVEDDLTPEAAFFLFIEVDIPNVPGVTSVTVLPPAGDPLVLENEDGARWAEEMDFADLASVLAVAHGTWTIDVAGGAPSESTFTIAASSIIDGDIFAVASMIAPASGASGVEPDVVFAWNDPTGGGAADAIFVSAEDDDGTTIQDDNSLFGSITVNDTTWDPPLDLADGGNEFGVVYVDLDDESRAGGLVVQQGAITWGRSPFAPEGYPDATPVFVLASERIILFEVGAPCPADLSGDGSVSFGDILLVLSSWGKCKGCPADIDGNGFVAFSDLLAVLASWGPCR
jgi:hypothetical protein